MRWQFSRVRSPGTTASTSRLSASTAVWSHRSPSRASAGSAGSQLFSFLATKLHFSSSWTSRVLGGKSRDLVVDCLAVPAGQAGVARDGVGPDVNQPAGGACAAPFLEVLHDGEDLLLGQLGAFKDGALALGEGPLASAAVHHADPLALARPAAEIQVATAALTRLRAVLILAAEVLDRTHGPLTLDASP